MTKHIKYDALKYIKENNGCTLIHVTNDAGVMGSGIALQVKNQFESVYRAYMHKYSLGSISGNLVDHHTAVWNLTAQEGYGCGKRFLNYGALSQCLNSLSTKLRREGWCSTIVVPKNMGACRAGGNWEIVLELVEWYFNDFKIIVCEWGEINLNENKQNRIVKL